MEKIEIKNSREYNISKEKDIILAEKTKASYNNAFDRVDVITTGLDTVIIRGTNIK